MGACIYLYSNDTSPALAKAGRVALAYDLNEFLAKAGKVTGGSGDSDVVEGWNLEIELSAGEDLPQWTQKVVRFLRAWGAPADIEMELFEETWTPGMPKRRIRLIDEP